MEMHERQLGLKLDQWNAEDQTRGSEVGEQRADVGNFLELTGWNKTAFSFARKLDKMTSEKREDVLRSFDDLRVNLLARWEGESTPDMLDGIEATAEGEDVSISDDSLPETDADFDAEVDAVMGDNVQPIDFSGQSAVS